MKQSLWLNAERNSPRSCKGMTTIRLPGSTLCSRTLPPCSASPLLRPTMSSQPACNATCLPQFEHMKTVYFARLSRPLLKCECHAKSKKKILKRKRAQPKIQKKRNQKEICGGEICRTGSWRATGSNKKSKLDANY